MLNWADQVGLLEASLETTSINLGLGHNLINDVLSEIQAAFRACVDIQAKFDPITKSPHLSSPPKQSPQRALKRRALLERVLDIHEKSFRAAGHLQWALIKKDSFEKLVEKLIMFNDKVESLLDRNALGELQTMQIQSNLMLLQVTDEVAKLRLLVEALKINQSPIDQNGYKTRNDRGSIDQRNPESTVASLAQFKSEASLLQQDITYQVPSRIDISHITLKGAECGTSRSLGRYDGHDIWLEWREQVEDGQFSPETQLVIERRVKQLATLLAIKDKPPLFKAPFCVGYTYDDKDESRRYALAYKVEVPPHSKYRGMRTLRDILGVYPVPSLGERFALASALTDSLFYLHAVSWLHKGIRSDNVLFFQYERTATKHEANEITTIADISLPVMSGFDYSRPDLVDEQSFRNTRTPSHDLYSHPDLLQFRTRRSRKCHDMYSLGLILVEIALWRPIEDIVGIEVRRSRLLEIAQTVTGLKENDNSLGSELAARVGDRYTEAVISCVSSENGNGAAAGSKEDDADFAAEMQESFFENVVLKLRRLRQLDF